MAPELRFQITKADDGRYSWRILFEDEGELTVLAESAPLAKAGDCYTAIATVQMYALNAEIDDPDLAESARRAPRRGRRS